jgi:hypothetical protein
VYGLLFDLQRSKELAVPAYTGSLDVRHVVLPSAERSSTAAVAR